MEDPRLWLVVGGSVGADPFKWIDAMSPEDLSAVWYITGGVGVGNMHTWPMASRHMPVIKYIANRQAELPLDRPSALCVQVGSRLDHLPTPIDRVPVDVMHEVTMYATHVCIDNSAAWTGQAEAVMGEFAAWCDGAGVRVIAEANARRGWIDRWTRQSLVSVKTMLDRLNDEESYHHPKTGRLIVGLHQEKDQAQVVKFASAYVESCAMAVRCSHAKAIRKIRAMQAVPA